LFRKGKMNLSSNFKNALSIIVLTLIMSFVSFGQQPIYLDSKQPIGKRVEDLLSRMTLEEKIGQLNMPTVYLYELGKDIAAKIDGCRKFSAGTLVPGIGPGGGLFNMRDILCPEGPRRQAELNNEFQKIAVEETHLKIPLIMIDESTHGLQASGATIFPEGLSIGSTWNMSLVKEIYSTVAREARSTGTNHMCTLVVEPNRDPRMGRNCEGFSEDSYICSSIAKAIVEGIQGDNVAAPDKAVAVLCHFPGQTQPVSGLENGEQEISDRTLRDIFLPSWQAGIKKSGALGVMATYPAIDGVPAHASEKLLTSILRGELGFEGLVLSEGGGISNLINQHVVSSQKEAGALALKSGVDVGISFEKAYMSSMVENIQEGNINISTIDRAVQRILLQKFRLGLFENPYVDPNLAESIIHREEHQELALKAAREGIVLLRNENKLLPLKKDIGSIAIIGPNADNDLNQIGDYTTRPVTQDIVTVLEGIKKKVSAKTKVSYVKGCNVMGNELNDIAKAKKAAKNADIAIVVVGENERYSPNGPTDGESRDISTLDLTGLQEDLVRAVYESGTPTILVLINGRPLSTRWIAEHIPAIIEPWFCGEKGGLAIADVIFGDYNPSGRLPITIPRNIGQLPSYYNYKYTKANAIDKAYVDISATPLFEFGFGLSYTSFAYDNLVISPQQIGTDGDVNITLDVTNTGDRTGSEVVQLYINDVISSVTTPVKKLKGFEKVTLEPGGKKTVCLKLHPEDLSLFDKDMNFLVEPGTFKVMIGSSSNDIRLKGEFEVKK
jgi:beta-glucosidase